MGFYGKAIDDTSPFFASTENDETILSQAIARRLATKRGSIWTTPDYGLALTEYVLAGLTTEALATIPAEVKAELEKDERIASLAVAPPIRSTLPGGGQSLRLSLTVTPSKGPVFSRVIAVSDLTVELLTKDA